MTRVVLSLLCVTTLLVSFPAGAARRSRGSAKANGVCTAAFQRAVALEGETKLIQARKEISACVKSRCSTAIKRKCLVRYTRLRKNIPSVIPEVRNGNGSLVRDVEVTMDGEMLTPYTDGRALQINPGLHEFSFSDEQGVIDKKSIEIAPGQQNRRIVVTTTR
jgi:hypothetical protein